MLDVGVRWTFLCWTFGVRNMLNTLDRWTLGRWDVRTLGRWDVGRWDVGTLGRWTLDVGRWPLAVGNR